MINWSLLPTDILNIIFEYVNPGDANYSLTDGWSLRKKDIQSCQQTCKSWAVVAQMHLYKYLELLTLDQAELFIHSLRNYNLGSLVKAIDFYLTERNSSKQKLSSLIQQIGYFCLDLKKLGTSAHSSIAVWKCIQIERSKGAFSKLQMISPPYFIEHRIIAHYYEVAYSLREMLPELTLYVGKLAPIGNLEFFTNINTLYFKLNSCADIYTAFDQQYKCSSVEAIDIEVTQSDHGTNKEYLLMRDARISSSIRICPQVKQLSFRNIAIDRKLCGYLMDVFPNLNKLELFTFSTTRSQHLDRIPNNTAHRFLSCLMKMSSAKVNYFPVQDAEDLLMNFHDINGMHRHLSISYERQLTSYIKLKISTNRKIDIEVMKSDNRELYYLPRLGMIEKSGKKFQSLTVNMSWILNEELDPSYAGADLYHILFYCPNMKNICIKNALLPCFSTHEHQRLRLSLNIFKIVNCAFQSSYLRNLSCHVNYINALTIEEGVFDPVKWFTSKSRVINMPETEFRSIDYFPRYAFGHIFLKLEKTVDDSVGWYVNKDNGLEKCTEEDFEVDKCPILIFICCVDIRMIKLHNGKTEIIFKP